jgi:predicted RNA methylase
MAMDRRRVNGFENAFRAILKETDRVLEIGTGTGILSLKAEPYCLEIIAVERDTAVSSYGKRIVEKHSQGKINYMTGDIRNFHFSEKFDAIICEIMDTGFFSEAQVGVMNYAVKNLLKEGGRVIPFGAKTSVQLVFVDFNIGDLGTFPLPHYETIGSRPKAQALSNQVLFHEIRFDEINSEHVIKDLEILPMLSGKVSGLRFVTDTLVTKDMLIEPTDWLNPWLIIPFEEEFLVEEGKSIRVKIDFVAGEGLSKVLISVIS